MQRTLGWLYYRRWAGICSLIAFWVQLTDMGYFEAVMASRPAGYWLLNEAGTTGTDYSGFGHSATKAIGSTGGPIVGNSYLSFFSGATTSTVTFPLLQALTVTNELAEATIEFVFKPLDVPSSTTLFEFGAGNGIYYSDAKVTFKLAGTNDDGSVLDARCQYVLPKVGSYHVVATYAPNGIRLFVNGVMVDSASLSQLFTWPTAPASYKSVTNNNSSGHSISNVAIYKRQLGSDEIFSHFRFSEIALTPIEIALQDQGRIFNFNDTDRTVALSHAIPRDYPWKSVTLSDCFINSDNNLSLRTIAPAVLSSGSASFTGSEITLAAGQYLTLQNAGNYFGPGAGAVGGMFYFDSVTHNNAAKYTLFTIADSKNENIFEVYKAASGGLTLGQTYKDYTGTLQTVTATVGTPSYSGYRYIYLTFDGSNATLYMNSNSVLAQIDLTTTRAPYFNTGTNIIIGADSTYANTWQQKIKMVTGYTYVPDIANFTSQQTVVGSFTLKLNSSVGLGVSQYGTAKFNFGSGFAGTISESRVVWHPTTANIAVSTSTDGTTYHAQSANNRNIFGITTTAPTNTYVLVELSTDDSVYDVPEVYDIAVKLFADGLVRSENSQDTMQTLGAYNFGDDGYSIFDRSQQDGFIGLGAGGMYLHSINDNIGSTLSFDGDSGSISAGPVRTYRTLELVIRQQPGFTPSSDYFWFSYNDGTTDFNFRHEGSTNLDKYNGFDTCWVNGAAFASGGTLNFVNGWAHVILTKAGWAAGMVPLDTEPGRINMNMSSSSVTRAFGYASYRHLGLYNQIFTITDAQRHYNQFFGRNKVTISDTDARSISDQGVGLFTGSWQIYGTV